MAAMAAAAAAAESSTMAETLPDAATPFPMGDAPLAMGDAPPKKPKFPFLPEELLLRVFEFAAQDFPLYSEAPLPIVVGDTGDTPSVGGTPRPSMQDGTPPPTTTTTTSQGGAPDGVLPEDDHPRRLLAHPLHAASLVSRQWGRLATALLWRRVLLEDASLIRFIRGVLESARADILSRISHIVDGGDSRHGGVGDNGLGDTHDKNDYKDALALVNNRLAALDAAANDTAARSRPLADIAAPSVVQVGPALAVDAPEDAVPATTTTTTTTTNNNNDDDDDGDDTQNNSIGINGLGPSALHITTILSLFAGSAAAPHNRLALSQREHLAAARAARRVAPSRLLPYGNGRLVQRLQIPSFGRNIDLIHLIIEFLPNWNAVLFMHPPHPKSYIPTLRPNLIRCLRPAMSRLRAITVEDVDEDGWVPLVRAIADNCINLKHLNLEAIPEKDHYRSTVGLAFLFESLPTLECLRMDGVPIGNDHFSPYGGDFDIRVMPTFCPQLRAINLDYCDITMMSFFTIWNECPNVEFLGFAGLGATQEGRWLVPKPRLRTLRFVDCDLTDAIMEDVAANAPNLDMIRLVYEDSELLKELDTTEDLSDAMLHAIARHCRSLRVLALSKTRRMTSDGFRSVLVSCPITVLDFHVTPHSDIGELTDAFVLDIASVMGSIKSVNFHGQKLLTESALAQWIMSGMVSQLVSLCLNQVKITRVFLDALVQQGIDDDHNGDRIGREPLPLLRRLSLIECDGLSAGDVLAFLETVDCGRVLRRLETVYSAHTLPVVGQEGVGSTLEPASAIESAIESVPTTAHDSANALQQSIPDSIEEIVDGDAENSDDYEDIDEDDIDSVHGPAHGDTHNTDTNTLPQQHVHATGTLISHRLVENADAWFTHEHLDIFSLWSAAVKASGNII